MKASYFLITVLSVLLLSCSASTDGATTSKTQEEWTPIFPDSILKIFSEEKDTDLKFDEAFFKNEVETSKKTKLSYKFIELFNKTLSNDSLTQDESYYLESYLKIEDLKKNNKYDKYVETLDLGMMKDAVASPIFRTTIADTLGLVFWTLSFSSYEACPYFQGESVFATLYCHEKPVSTFVIAKQESSADAPMGSNVNIFSSVSKSGVIKQNYTSEVFEEETIVEKNKRSHKYQLGPNGLSKK